MEILAVGVGAYGVGKIGFVGVQQFGEVFTFQVGGGEEFLFVHQFAELAEELRFFGEAVDGKHFDGVEYTFLHLLLFQVALVEDAVLAVQAA